MTIAILFVTHAACLVVGAIVGAGLTAWALFGPVDPADVEEGESR